MSPLEIGSLIALSTIIILATGIPVAFGLIFIAISFLLFFEGFYSLNFLGELFFSGISDFTLISIPMFIAMGGAILVLFIQPFIHTTTVRSSFFRPIYKKFY